MRVAALYDIHGNLPALDAVLREVEGEGVDLIVVGGDVLPGPMPSATLDVLSGLSVPTRFIRGNGDADVSSVASGEMPSRVPEPVRPLLEWTVDVLTDEQVDMVSAWPATLAIDVPGVGRVVFCHATPRDDNEIFTRLTPDDRVRPVLAGLEADLVVCGHTHMQFDRVIGDMRVVNAGSVGMPFGGPGADWLMLGPEVELRHTDYDLEAAASRVRESEYPQADGFASGYVLDPPKEADMVELLERSALGGPSS